MHVPWDDIVGFRARGTKVSLFTSEEEQRELYGPVFLRDDIEQDKFWSALELLGEKDQDTTPERVSRFIDNCKKLAKRESTLKDMCVPKMEVRFGDNSNYDKFCDEIDELKYDSFLEDSSVSATCISLKFLLDLHDNKRRR